MSGGGEPVLSVFGLVHVSKRPLIAEYEALSSLNFGVTMLEHLSRATTMIQPSLELGLRRAFIIEMVESKKRGDKRLGFTMLNYGRLFVRDYWTLFAIARELECTVADLASTDVAKSGPRMSELVSSADRITETVRTLPATLRSVVSARGKGHSWRRIRRDSPGRLEFSLRDDFEQGMRLIITRCSDDLTFLANAENIFVVTERPVVLC